MPDLKPGLLLAVLVFPAPAQRFALIGDRTGEHVSGAYEQVWKEVAAAKPSFVLSVGDTIEGWHDDTAETEWRDLFKGLPALPLYLTPGNHDIWSPLSEQLFRKYAKHQTHYSFDSGPAHFTILDNSRSDALSLDELAFLEDDLKAHQSQPVKFVISHRPSWLLNVMLGDTTYPLHRLAKKYGVRYIIAGHVHEMLHARLENVDYISMVSAGGHLRASAKYEDGWFFGYALLDLAPAEVKFEIHELGPPLGKARVSTLENWGKAGLTAIPRSP